MNETQHILTIEPMEECFHESREWQWKQSQSKHQVEVQDSIYKVEMPWLCTFEKKTSTIYRWKILSNDVETRVQRSCRYSARLSESVCWSTNTFFGVMFKIVVCPLEVSYQNAALIISSAQP